MTFSTAISTAFEADNHLGETPLWSSEEQALYWVNCEQPYEIHRWQPESSAHKVWPMDKRVGGIVQKGNKQLLVVLADGIYDFSTESGELSLRIPSPLPKHVALHECQCDRQGRLWVGAYDHHFNPTNRDAKDGAIFRLDGDTLTPVIPNISVANGLAISPDGKTLYVSDSPTKTVQAYDLNTETGALSNGRLFCELKDGEGFIDGATVDAEGAYWLATVGVGSLRRYLPDGTLDRVISTPVCNPTKPAFGGPSMDTLFFTTTRLQIGPNSQANGAIYSLQPGEKGVEEPIWKE